MEDCNCNRGYYAGKYFRTYPSDSNSYDLQRGSEVGPFKTPEERDEWIRTQNRLGSGGGTGGQYMAVSDR